MVQTSLGKKRDPISKITRAKRAGGVAQVVEPLPSKCKALSSNPKTKKKKKKERKEKLKGQVLGCQLLGASTSYLNA
jgi:hypothetical protein